ncbi:MAG: 5-oxoprolinase subunit PxpB [Bacteroidota bacterium]
MIKSIQTYGDRALLVSFEQKIDVEVNEAVIALNEWILAEEIKGLKYTVPAYCSLTLAYDPSLLEKEELMEKISVFDQYYKGQKRKSGRYLQIPVCYEDNFALDKEEVILQTGLSWKEVLNIHTQTRFRVFMLGFLPGFTYMGKLPQVLFCKRRKEPRFRVPKSSVGLAGFQTGIYPSVAPGGWQLIGKTPLEIFDSARPDPFLFHAGDELHFYPIDLSTFKEIEKKVVEKEFDYESLIQ